MSDCQWAQELIVTLYKRQRMLRILFVIALIPVIAILLWGYLSSLNLHRRNEEALSWIQTPCKIDYVERVGFGTNNSRRYKIQYRYSYDDSSYVASRFSIPRKNELVVWERSSPQFNEFSQFSENQRTVCYVNPAFPEEAVLSQSSLAPGDYTKHLVRPAAVFVLYLFVPSFVYRKCRVTQKQLRELITGQKENILEEMDQLSKPLDDETQRIIERMSVRYFSAGGLFFRRL